MSDDLSASEAARRIGTSTRTVQRWIATGRLPARRVGGRWRVASDALARSTRPTPAESPAPVGRSGRCSSRTAARSPPGSGAPRDRLGIATIVPPTDGPDAVDLLDDRRRRRGRDDGRRRRAPSRLRVPRRERRLRRGGHRGRHPLGRAAAGRDPGDGRQGRRAPARRGARRAGRPGLRRRRTRTTRPSSARRPRSGCPLLVKPAAGGGGKGMRVVRTAAALERELRDRAARGARGVRRRPARPRAAGRGSAPRRGPGAVRRPRPRRPPRRARLLDPAPPPEGPRGDAVARRPPGDPPPPHRCGAPDRASRRLRERGNLRVPPRRTAARSSSSR